MAKGTVFAPRTAAAFLTPSDRTSPIPCLKAIWSSNSNITGTFSEVLSTLSYILDKVAGGIQKVIDWIIELGTKTSVVFDPIKAVGTWFENFISFITPKLKWLADKIGEIFEELGSGVSGAFGNLNTNAVWGFANAGMIAGLVAGIKGFLAAFKDIGSTIKDTVGGVTELLNKLGEAIAAWKIWNEQIPS